jgi:hypothetical protein
MTGGGMTGGGTTGGGSTGGGATGGGVTGGGVTGGGVTGGGTGGGGVARLCGGFAGLMCSAGEVCNWLDNSCGAADATGVCEARPQACPAVYMPVCGCDGQVHGNECEALAAGADVSAFGGCTPPPGTFACGWRFCPRSGTYCSALVGGPAGGPGSYDCAPLPTSCGNTPSCSCLQVGPACQCTQSPNGDLTVRCFAP